MDKELIKQLKEMGLLPVEMDEEAQKRDRTANEGLAELCKKWGIDPIHVERPYNPGTPPHIAERQLMIERNAARLYEMEQAGKSGTPEYKRMEADIKIELDELCHCVQSPHRVGIFNSSP